MSFNNSKVQSLINKIKSQILGDIEDKIEEHDVVANSSRTGHVQAGSSPQDINTLETSSAGTDNGYYARADHVHKIAIASTTEKGIVQLDSTPTTNSSNGVTSHGIKTALNEVMNGTNIGTFAELQTLITDASSGDTIILDRNYKNAGSESRIEIDKPLTIIGNGHIIDADGKSSIFYISSEGNGCKINSLIFMNGKSNYDSGAIRCSSSNTISDCSFINNIVTNYSNGGAILCNSSNTISDCSFNNNRASNTGGAIYLVGSDCNIINCSFDYNFASDAGGAIRCSSSNTISDCSFNNNTATNGANVYNYTSATSLIIYNCHVTTGLYNAVNYDDVNSSNLLDLIYPIGSIYLDAGNHNVCPIQTLLGGTWSRIEDKFLLSSGSTYTATYDSNGFANKTGGSADAVVVEHNHQQNAHSHTPTNTSYKFVAAENGMDLAMSNSYHLTTGTGYSYMYSTSKKSVIEYASTGTATPTISSTGESGTGKNMPPYLVVNVWKRTA